MKCDQVEELLPEYASGELEERKIAHVEDHLVVCGRCRSSSEVYLALEGDLGRRREEMPPGGLVADAVMRRLPSDGKRIRVPGRWLVPGILGSTTLAAAAVMLLYRGHVARFMYRAGVGAAGALVSFFDLLPAWVIQPAGGKTWILFTVYTLFSVLIALTGGFVIERHVLKH